MPAGNPVAMLERRARGAGRGADRSSAGHLADLMDDRLESASYLYNRDLRAHYGCINAIEFSPSGSLMVSGKSRVVSGESLVVPGESRVVPGG